MNETTNYHLAILQGLQSKPMYGGTVPHHVKADRRRKNTAGKASRRINRRAN